MIANADHPLWHDDNTKRQLEELLNDHVDACTSVVRDTYFAIQEFKKRLSKFQVPSVSMAENDHYTWAPVLTFLIEIR